MQHIFCWQAVALGACGFECLAKCADRGTESGAQRAASTTALFREPALSDIRWGALGIQQVRHLLLGVPDRPYCVRKAAVGRGAQCVGHLNVMPPRRKRAKVGSAAKAKGQENEAPAPAEHPAERPSWASGPQPTKEENLTALREIRSILQAQHEAGALAMVSSCRCATAADFKPATLSIADCTPS